MKLFFSDGILILSDGILILSTPETLSIAIDPVEGLNDNVMLVEVLLQLVRLGCDAALLLQNFSHCVKN